MADKKLNEVTKVTDMAYVPVIMSDGSIGQIAKADLASVVAGQMKPMLCESGSVTSDFNSYISAGTYSIIDPSFSLANTPKVDYGCLIVFKAVYGYIIQICVNISGNTWVRFINASQNTFGNWKQLHN